MKAFFILLSVALLSYIVYDKWHKDNLSDLEQTQNLIATWNSSFDTKTKETLSKQFLYENWYSTTGKIDIDCQKATYDEIQKMKH